MPAAIGAGPSRPGRDMAHLILTARGAQARQWAHRPAATQVAQRQRRACAAPHLLLLLLLVRPQRRPFPPDCRTPSALWTPR
nr:unnamed protein product [Digitaria exilis]